MLIVMNVGSGVDGWFTCDERGGGDGELMGDYQLLCLFSTNYHRWEGLKKLLDFELVLFCARLQAFY